jgi:hypothetical protein
MYMRQHGIRRRYPISVLPELPMNINYTAEEISVLRKPLLSHALKHKR